MGIQGSGDVRRGFLTQGLFAYSRHPNFFAEQVRSRRALLLLLLQAGLFDAVVRLPLSPLTLCRLSPVPVVDCIPL